MNEVACLLRNLCISLAISAGQILFRGLAPPWGGKGSTKNHLPKRWALRARPSEVDTLSLGVGIPVSQNWMACCAAGVLRDAFIAFKACGHVQWICGFGDFVSHESRCVVSKCFTTDPSSSLWGRWSRCQIAWVLQWPLVIFPFGYVKCGCLAMSSICNPTRNQETELKSASRHQHCQVDVKK